MENTDPFLTAVKAKITSIRQQIDEAERLKVQLDLLEKIYSVLSQATDQPETHKVQESGVIPLSAERGATEAILLAIAAEPGVSQPELVKRLAADKMVVTKSPKRKSLFYSVINQLVKRNRISRDDNRRLFPLVTGTLIPREEMK